MSWGNPKKFNKLFVLFAVGGIAVGWASTATAQQAPSVNAALVAAQCVVCHGPDGAGSGDVPQLNNLPAQALKDRLVAARTGGGKPNTIMTRISKGLNEAQIDAVANYFGKK